MHADAGRRAAAGRRDRAPPPGFGDDEWAGQLADGRVLAFLREPVARCHLDRLLLVDGERRVERPLPAWVYYGHFLAPGARGLLIGGARSAWLVDGDGAMTTLLDEPDGDGVHVCWLDDGTAVAAGWRARRARRAARPRRAAVQPRGRRLRGRARPRSSSATTTARSGSKTGASSRATGGPTPRRAATSSCRPRATPIACASAAPSARG